MSTKQSGPVKISCHINGVPISLHTFKKKHISIKLDKGFRLVNKLSYLDDENFLLYFHYTGGTLSQKKSIIFFSSRYDKIYTAIESPCLFKEMFRIIRKSRSKNMTITFF
jgi:hypothetical protein